MLTRQIVSSRGIPGSCSKLFSRFQSGKAGEPEEVKTYVVEYKYVPNMLERRTPYRPAHLDFAKPFVENKTMIAGGAILPAVEFGMLVFNCRDNKG